MEGQPVRRRIAAPILALLVVCAGLAPALLDATDAVATTRVESEHDPGTCGRLHDHAACTQLVKSFGHLAWGPVATHGERRVLRASRIDPTAALPFRAFSSVPSPRAPPIPHS